MEITSLKCKKKVKASLRKPVLLRKKALNNLYFLKELLQFEDQNLLEKLALFLNKV